MIGRALRSFPSRSYVSGRSFSSKLKMESVTKNGYAPWEVSSQYCRVCKEDEGAEGSLGGNGWTGLKLRNSLTDTVEPFVPMNGRAVTWYTCGPTVYDSAHLGHARAYLCFDIMRRIMEDYFGYEVFYQMNITDIDDKIIMRGRRNLQLQEWLETVSEWAKVKETLEAALKMRGDKAKKNLDDTKAATDFKDEEEKETKVKEAALKMEQFEEVNSEFVKVLESAKAKAPAGKAELQEVVRAFSDPMSEYLDKTQQKQYDNSVFEAHARKFEKEFWQDMEALKVRFPDCVTRVTEYVPAITEFVKKIIDKGIGYESNGSVYFDIGKFKETNSYPKLRPLPKEKAAGLSAAEMAEGEGDLAGEAGEKRHPHDFAVWKASKAGEPKWESPWGNGRPGWHIECSVMATEVLGEKMDMHSGGPDLKNTHHPNEMAQSECYHGNQQWVNYWTHAGRLDIRGLKMSKSLKNFTTIRQALDKDLTARQLRLLFLRQPWDKPINYSLDQIQVAKEYEKKINSFCGRVKELMRNSDQITEQLQRWEEIEKELSKKIQDAHAKIHVYLCDNFNTPQVMNELLNLITECNKYLDTPNLQPRVFLLRKCAILICKFLRIFGVITGADDIGFSSSDDSGGGREAVGGPFVDAFVQFRDDVKSIAFEQKLKPVLEACDNARDSTLMNLGVRLKDNAANVGGSSWMFEDPATLQREVRDKELEKLGKLLNKKSVALEAAVAAKDKVAKHMNPEYDFGEGYGAERDAEGLPSKTKEGEEVSKGAKKTLKKALDNYTKAYKDFTQKAAGEAGDSDRARLEAFAAKLEADIAAQTAECQEMTGKVEALRRAL